MKRFSLTVALAAAFALLPAPGSALAASAQQPVQAPASRESDLPSFEVVSVKINRSNSPNQSMRLLPGGRAVV